MQVNKQENGVERLSDFESVLLEDPEVEWIKLKVFDDHDIAVGLYQNRNTISGRIHVSVYRFSKVEFMGGEGLNTETLPGTKRSFKKRDLKIAKWYFRELCRSFKDGICVVNGNKRTPLGKWD